MNRTLATTSLALGLACATPAVVATAAPSSTTYDTRPAAASARPLSSPLILAHRGASGYRPEHTVAAYELAVAMGADYFEPDLVMTRDGVLVDRHEPEISQTTDVGDHPEFAARKTTKILDGISTTGWFTEDFTLAELKTLRAKERLPDIRQENTLYDGRYQITTFAEDLRLREQLSRKYGREVGIIPEIKHSTYFHAAGLNPERIFLRQVDRFGLNRASAPLWLQSFELTNLVQMRTVYGYKAKSVFLATNGGAPYDLVDQGDPRTYADLLKPDALRYLARYVNGVGPDKTLVIPRNADGTLATTPTALVTNAHAAGLKVTPYTFRAENVFLPTDYQSDTDPADFGRAIDEDLAYMRAGIDGMFCDQPDICIVARDQFLAERAPAKAS